MEQERQPRPMGLTELSLRYQQSPNTENKQLLIKHLIKHWITNNFNLNNQHLSIDQLSYITNIDTHTIIQEINRQSKGLMDLTDKESLGNTVRALLSLSIRHALTDRGLIAQQLSILKASQGNGYKAFISGEVNKTLDLLMKSSQNILHTTKALMPSGGTSINIFNHTETTTQNYIDGAQATQMIKASGQIPLKEDPERLQGLKAAYNLEGLPEVDARYQTGDHAQKEGLGLSHLTELPNGPKIGHEDRRVEEIGIDLDEDDI